MDFIVWDKDKQIPYIKTIIVILNSFEGSFNVTFLKEKKSWSLLIKLNPCWSFWQTEKANEKYPFGLQSNLWKYLMD